MLSQEMQKALNDQVNAELHSAYIYLSMAAYFESVDLPGFATWMKVQVQEELFHADKFYNFIVERDGRALMQPIEGVPSEWDSPLAAFQAALEHERYITGRINDLVTLALKTGDHATHNFLQWFVNEQVEEEANAKGVVQQLKLIGKDGAGLFMVDRELGQRVFVLPTAATPA